VTAPVIAHQDFLTQPRTAKRTASTGSSKGKKKHRPLFDFLSLVVIATFAN
jgi:hypothetical protein